MKPIRKPKAKPKQAAPPPPPPGHPPAPFHATPAPGSSQAVPDSQLIDEQHVELTLAQRMGLVERPPTPLTEAKWEQVLSKFRERECASGATPCPICREGFRNEDQVLLSCSHVFHRTCIRSYERFARDRCCPLCRCKFYEKRLIHDGPRAFTRASAIRIQKCVRGYFTRKWYRKVLNSIPPKDPDERRQWFCEKLEEKANSLFSEMDATRAEADALFAEIDARRIDQSGEVEGEGGGALERWVPLGPVLSPPSSPPSRLASSQRVIEKRKPAAVTGHKEIDWDHVIGRALERGDTECPICMGELQRNGKSQVAWLSCTHVFHLDCICAFERFQVGGAAAMARDAGNVSSSGEPTEAGTACACPVCRAQYSRRQFD